MTSIYDKLSSDIDKELDELDILVDIDTKTERTIRNDLRELNEVNERDGNDEIADDEETNGRGEEIIDNDDIIRIGKDEIVDVPDKEVIIKDKILTVKKTPQIIRRERRNEVIRTPARPMKYMDNDEVNSDVNRRKERRDTIPYEDKIIHVDYGKNPFPGYVEPFVDVNFYSFCYSVGMITPDKFLDYLRRFKIDFPYKRHLFNRGPQPFFDRLLNSSIPWDTTPYKIKEAVNFSHKFFPVQIKGESVTVSLNSIYLRDSKSVSEYDETVNPITDYFTENSRVKARRKDKKISIYEAWVTDDQYVKDLGKISLEEYSVIDPSTLRESMYLNKTYSECSGERVSFLFNLFRYLLKDILSNGNVWNSTNGNRIDVIERNGSERNGNVNVKERRLKIFDACGGYGDRLLAAIALDCDYLGVEPNSLSKSGFDEIIRTFGDPDKHKMLLDYMPQVDIEVPFGRQLSFEEGSGTGSQLSTGSGFDLSFLSPPGFDSEIYIDENTQSINKYPRMNDWFIKFLFPTIDKCIRVTGKNRFFVIQSILIKYINSYIMIRYPRMTLLGAISVKTFNGRNKPMWVWLKKHVQGLDVNVSHSVSQTLVFDREIQEHIENLGIVDTD